MRTLSRAGAAVAALAISALAITALTPGADAATPTHQAGPGARSTSAADAHTSGWQGTCRQVIDGAARISSLGSLRALASHTDADGSHAAGVTPRIAAAAQTDPTLRVNSCGAPYVEDSFSFSGGDPLTAPAKQQPARLIAPKASTFNLSSRPKSLRTIYLDFTGAAVKNTYWNKQKNGGKKYVVPTWSLDGSKAFSSTELAYIQGVWAEVSEDFAPFDVNVTTKPPGTQALLHSVTKRRHGHLVRDRRFGTQVLIMNEQPWKHRCQCSGVAFIKALANTGKYSPLTRYANVFTSDIHGPDNIQVKWIADVVSHETGHTFGLLHDGKDAGGHHTEYYQGTAPWSPLMGYGNTEPLSQWSSGEYAGANRHQDDVKLIRKLSGPMKDDHKDRPKHADSLLKAGHTGGKQLGLISTRADKDYFKIVVGKYRTVTVAAASRAVFGNLDIALAFRDRKGHVIKRADPVTTAPTSLSMSGADAIVAYRFAKPGIYFVSIDGAGQGNPHTNGYSDYGSLGRYVIVAQAR